VKNETETETEKYFTTEVTLGNWDEEGDMLPAQPLRALN